MWATLLHEMVHAYLRVTIEPTRRVIKRTDPQGIHGRHFQRCLRAINARAAELGLGIGGVFEGEWAVHVEEFCLDDYRTTWPIESEGEEEEDFVAEQEVSLQSTAVTTPSLGALGVEQSSESDLG